VRINCFIGTRPAIIIHCDNARHETPGSDPRSSRSDYYSKRESQHWTCARNTGRLEKNQPATLRSVIALRANWSSAALLFPLPRAPFSYASFGFALRMAAKGTTPSRGAPRSRACNPPACENCVIQFACARARQAWLSKRYISIFPPLKMMIADKSDW